MENYSTIQASNIAAIVGVLVLILPHFHINIGSDELTGVIGAGITIISSIVSWVSRYRKGDLTASGFRK